GCVAGPGHGPTPDRPAVLLKGHHGGEAVTGMRRPRQSVYHGDRGVVRHLGDRRWVQHPDHDRIDVAREHAGSISQRLAAAELHFLRGQENGVAAELAHGDFEGHAGASRRPLEDHGERLAGKAAPPAGAARFHRAGALDYAAQIGGRDLDQVKKMPDALHRAASCLDREAAVTGTSPLRASRAQARSRRRTPSAISCSLMISGGSRRTTLSPAATASIFSARSALTSSPAGMTARKPTRSPSPRISAINDG